MLLCLVCQGGTSETSILEFFEPHHENPLAFVVLTISLGVYCIRCMGSSPGYLAWLGYVLFLCRDVHGTIHKRFTGDSHSSPGMLEFSSLIKELHPNIYIHSVFVEENLEADREAGFVRSFRLFSFIMH